MFSGISAINLTQAFDAGPAVQPTSQITQTSNWFGDTFIQPWADAAGTLADVGASTLEQIGQELPNYFMRKWGILPEPADTGDTRIPKPQPADITIPMPDWAKQFLQKPRDIYEQAPGQINLGLVAIALVIVFFIFKSRGRA